MNPEQKIKYMGAEAQANGLSLADYQEDIGEIFGCRWMDIPNDSKTEARRWFAEGRRSEREANK